MNLRNQSKHFPRLIRTSNSLSSWRVILRNSKLTSIRTHKNTEQILKKWNFRRNGDKNLQMCKLDTLSEVFYQAPRNNIHILAPAAGIIIGYKVAEGDKVSSGQPILVLEMMKMHISITSPSGGNVSFLHLTSRKLVAKNQLLAIITS